MAGFLPFIGAAAGLLQGFGQNSAAAGQQRRALDLYDDARRREEQERERRIEQARQLIAGGYGDPAAQVAAIDGDYEAAQKIGHRNLLGAYGTMGYELGDTPVAAAQQTLSTRGLAQQAALKASARANAANQLLSLQSLYSPSGVNSAAVSEANAIASSPVNQQQDLSGLIGGLTSMDYGFLKPRKPKNDGWSFIF